MDKKDIITDYAKMQNMEAWLRHPVLGDPSFDNFTKLGQTVHRSKAPFEWAVNGSIFSDPKTDWWYYYVACYPRGYWRETGDISHFLIYRSKDKGLTWENLGRGFKDDFCHFPNLRDTLMCAPDAVLMYDEEEDIYWLTYDWGTGRFVNREGQTPHAVPLPDAGVALAWAKSPEGPFHKLDTWVHNNRFSSSGIGRFNRGYSSSTFKRKNDWICFIMQDSAPCYGWGLTCRTAKTPDGQWSAPRLLLSPDRPEYYPETIEFCFCVQIGDKVYAPGTSVAGNRNYQIVFAADLEEAEHPWAWKMVREGSLWHSRPLADERYGIWGQTLHGFMKDGKYHTMYAGMDENNCGTLSVATCPVAQPFKDGFTISGHAGRSVAPILAAYRDFDLQMQLEFTGTVEVFLKYHGIMGPNQCTSDAVTSGESFADSLSLEMGENGRFRVLLRSGADQLQVLHSGSTDAKIRSVDASWAGRCLALSINGEKVYCGDLTAVLDEAVCNSPLAVCAHEVSVLDCSSFAVKGQPLPYSLRYSARDGVLTAMHSAQWQPVCDDRFLTEKGYIGEGDKWIKWNIRADGFRIYAPKGPDLGRAEIWVDGCLYGTVDLYSEENEASKAVYEVCGIPGDGRHGVVLKGYLGQPFGVDVLEAFGKPAAE